MMVGSNDTHVVGRGTGWCTTGTSFIDKGCRG